MPIVLKNIPDPTVPARRRRFSSINTLGTQAFLDSINFRIVILDSNHTVLLVNKYALQALSINPQDYIGKKCPHYKVGTKCLICPLDKSIKESAQHEIEYYDSAIKKSFRSVVSPLPFVTDDQLSTFALIINDISDIKKANIEIDNAVIRYSALASGTIEAIQNMTATRDPSVGIHQKEVARLAVAIAQIMGLSPEMTEGLRVAALLHDVGKIAVPSEILSRPGKLSRNEFALIQAHAEEGFKILKNIDFPFPLAEIVYQHHERLDGSGYPRGLKGKEILTETRIVSVAEVVESMGSHRPYRPARPTEDALAEIESKSGTKFDPAVVKACVFLFRKKEYMLRKEVEPYRGAPGRDTIGAAG
ncbi:MAG: HD domain-containing protein [Candidatus Aminicenantes bacterium]|nr:HD domain-containing protein [Candidatus Aminicenantes bacterium]